MNQLLLRHFILTLLCSASPVFAGHPGKGDDEDPYNLLPPPTTISLPCPASEIELVDVIGRRSRRGVAGGVLTLRVDASPLYVVLRR